MWPSHLGEVSDVHSHLQKWVRFSLTGPWLLPVLGGYSASIALFNLVEPLNQHVLSYLDYAPEGFVAKLANPADKRLSSLLIASITPCVGAPLFEELQSRAFVLQVTDCCSLDSQLLHEKLPRHIVGANSRGVPAHVSGPLRYPI